MNKRRHQLKQYHHLLNTEEGKELMRELKSAWHEANPLDPNVQTMGFNLGLSEAYKQLEAWQEGQGLEDMIDPNQIDIEAFANG
jgi:hypothetical protein